jgi:hypothetical protein
VTNPPGKDQQLQRRPKPNASSSVYELNWSASAWLASPRRRIAALSFRPNYSWPGRASVTNGGTWKRWSSSDDFQAVGEFRRYAWLLGSRRYWSWQWTNAELAIQSAPICSPARSALQHGESVAPPRFSAAREEELAARRFPAPRRAVLNKVNADIAEAEARRRCQEERPVEELRHHRRCVENADKRM